MWNKKILILISALVFGLTSCRTPKVIYRDSIRVEVKEKIIRDTDTLHFPVPVEVIKNVTTDTTSTVETSLATSTATIVGGLLYHSIENKKQVIDIPYEKETHYKDSTSLQQHIVYKTEYINKPTKWQKFKMRFFWLFIGLAVVLIGWKLLKIYLKKIAV